MLSHAVPCCAVLYQSVLCCAVLCCAALRVCCAALGVYKIQSCVYAKLCHAVPCWCTACLGLHPVNSIRSVQTRVDAQGLIKPPAGICPVPVVGIENVDVSEQIDGHQAYTTNMDAVLDKLGLS